MCCPEPSKTTVVVGMSGGVDSSVAAYLLKEQGYQVIGIYMKNWEEEEGPCHGLADYEDVVRVCDQLGIPHYSVNFVKEYWDQVFQQVIAGFKVGLTPNPDILCNREIKFKELLNKAFAFGGDYLATGHYCRLSQSEGGALQLLKGADPEKDQSYFLSAVPAAALERALFPLGAMKKSEVRAIAKREGLATAAKKDSTGICFIGKRNFRQFLSRYIPQEPGEIVTVDGQSVGEHEGVYYYTIGQRKGLKIGGPGAAWFVVGKDLERNELIVAQGEEDEKLYSHSLIAVEPTWVDPAGAPELPFRCKAKIRYRQEDQPCIIEAVDEEGRLHVSFDLPQRAVTPMQSVVFYDGEVCLGGAFILSQQPSDICETRR